MKKKSKKDSKPKEEKQLDLGIKEPFKNRFYKLKGKTDKAVQRLEVRKYLKDPLTWGVIIVCFILIATQGYLIYSHWDTFPTLIPIFKYQLQNAQKLASSDYVLIYPGLSLLALIFTISVTGKFYSREKYLVKFLLVSTFLSTFSLTVILIDLIRNI